MRSSRPASNPEHVPSALLQAAQALPDAGIGRVIAQHRPELGGRALGLAQTGIHLGQFKTRPRAVRTDTQAPVVEPRFLAQGAGGESPVEVRPRPAAGVFVPLEPGRRWGRGRQGDGRRTGAVSRQPGGELTQRCRPLRGGRMRRENPAVAVSGTSRAMRRMTSAPARGSYPASNA